MPNARNTTPGEVAAAVWLANNQLPPVERPVVSRIDQEVARLEAYLQHRTIAIGDIASRAY